MVTELVNYALLSTQAGGKRFLEFESEEEG